MSIAQQFLAEFEQEAAITRRFLERLPEDQLTWKPHERSMTAGQLALHLATTPGGVIQMAGQDTVSPPSFGAPPQPAKTADVLAALDQSIATVRELLPKIGDDRMTQMWRVMDGGRELFSLPRAAMIRMIMLSHWIQHRGQFSVYLRLLGQKVPSSYGPSADELPEFMQSATA